MQINSKTITIRRELYEVVRIRNIGRIKTLCHVCESPEEFLTFDGVVNLFHIGTREILTRIESGKVHTEDTSNGRMLVRAGSIRDLAA